MAGLTYRGAGGQTFVVWPLILIQYLYYVTLPGLCSDYNTSMCCTGATGRWSGCRAIRHARLWLGSGDNNTLVNVRKRLCFRLLLGEKRFQKTC